MVSVPPDNGDNDAVPEGPDAALACGMDALGVLPSENFETQGGPENANHAIDRRGDEGNLNAAGPGQLWKAGVVVRADWFASDCFRGILRGIGRCGAGCVWCGHGFGMRQRKRRRDV